MFYLYKHQVFTAYSLYTKPQLFIVLAPGLIQELIDKFSLENWHDF